MRETMLTRVETTIAPPKPSQVLPGLMRGIILCLPISEPTHVRAQIAEFRHQNEIAEHKTVPSIPGKN